MKIDVIQKQPIARYTFDLTPDQRIAVNEIIAKIQFTTLFKPSPGTVYTHKDFRLDLQGFTANKKEYNFQIQSRGRTVSAVLINSNIESISQEHRSYAQNRIRSAFVQSYTKRSIFVVEFSQTQSYLPLAHVPFQMDYLFLQKKSSDIMNNLENVPQVKGTIFLGRCTDITSLDPSFMSGSMKLIRALDWTNFERGYVTEDGTKVPEGVVYSPLSKQELNFSSNIFKSMDDFTRTMKTTISFGGDPEEEGGKTLPFSASISFKNVNQQISTRNVTVVYNEMVNSLYLIRENIAFKKGPDLLNQEFGVFAQKVIDAVKSKDEKSISSSLDNFIKNCGTHYNSQVILGGKGIQFLFIDTKTLVQMREKGITIDATARNAFFKGQVSNEQKSTFETFKEQTKMNVVFTGGTRLPSVGSDGNLDFSVWSDSIENQPVPIFLELTLLSDLFTQDIFENEDPILLSNVQSRLIEKTNLYITSKIPPHTSGDKPLVINSSYFSLAILKDVVEFWGPAMKKGWFDPFYPNYYFPTLATEANLAPVLTFLSFDIQSGKVLSSGDRVIIRTTEDIPLDSRYVVYYDQVNPDDQLYIAYDATSTAQRFTVIKEQLFDDSVIRNNDNIYLKHDNGWYISGDVNENQLYTLCLRKEPFKWLVVLKDGPNT